MKGWLGDERMVEILMQRSFVCHKRHDLQCAGHMLLRGQENDFVQLATRLGIPLKLSGRELIFDNVEQCVAHHKR